MAIERNEAEGRTPLPAGTTEKAGPTKDDPVLATFAELVGDLSLDLSRATLGPALQGMHDEWRSEAGQLRRDTAEWISRVNASRQHMDQAVERQHELAQELYSTHSELLQEMVAFQKERSDQLRWQEQVSAGLARLGELHQALSIETTRTAGVVKDIIGELARFQTDLERRHSLFEDKVSDILRNALKSMQEELQEARHDTEQAMEALSKTTEETRLVLGRDVNASRRELQEVATRLGRDLSENQGALQQKMGAHANHLGEQLQATGNRLLGFVIFGQIAILGALAYLIYRLM